MSAFSTDFDDSLSSWGNHAGHPPMPQPLDQKVAKFLGELTRPQREAAEANGPVLTLAGAGTGKTKTLTTTVLRRLRDGVAPSRILAVTFTNSAADEMRERIKAMLGEESVPAWIGTFHGLSSRLLRQVPEIAGLRPNFDILDAEDSARILKRVMIEVGLPVARDEDAGLPVKAMIKYIEELKDLLVLPNESDDAIEAIIRRERATGGKTTETFIRHVPDVYAQYQSALREVNAADFADLLLWPTLGMHRRDSLRKRWARQFDVIAGDEYQDVGPSEYCFLRLLSRDHQQLFVVGDDDQSIYSFRRADIQYIRRFTKDFPQAKVIRLEENFRSTGHILAAANAVISKDANRLGKTLFTKKGMGAPIEIVQFRNAEEEAEGIALEIEQRHKAGTPWNDIAILYRANHLSRLFEDALIRARIPHEIQGDVGFYQRREIKDALALLRLSLMPDDHQSDEAFRRMINTPARGLGPKSLDAIEGYAAERGLCLLAAAVSAPLKPTARQACTAFTLAIQKCQRIRHRPLSDQLRAAVEFTGYAEMWRTSREDGAKERLENLNELYTAVGKYESVQALFEHAALAGRERNNDTADRVRLMTLHGAKGSEFGTVFLPAWEEAIFPNPRAVAGGDVAEERRLAYVGLTRAMRRCTISYAIWRRGENVPSPYIADIPQEHLVQGWLSGTA